MALENGKRTNFSQFITYERALFLLKKYIKDEKTLPIPLSAPGKPMRWQRKFI
jgi:predicted hydrolase (HD superfamily)